MAETTLGRRVEARADLERGGDYCYVEHDSYRVDPDTQEVVEWRPTIYFLLPGARDEDTDPPKRSWHKVCEPPHVFRHCADGSIEVRESIGCGSQPEGGYYWHGYLDEGHVWREVG